MFLRMHHEGEPAEQRPRIEPAQVIAEVDHHADNQEASADRPFLQLLFERAQCSGDGALRGERALQDDRRRLVRRSSVIDERPQHLRQLLRPGIRHDRAVQCRQRRPVDPGPLAALVFVAAHERDGVAAPGIGDRNAGIRRGADRMRHARHHFVAHALLVKEQRLFAPLIEQKRIAPLEPRHGLAFARLFGEQVTDRVLIARLGRGAADVDPLGVFRRDRQQLRVTR